MENKTHTDQVSISNNFDDEIIDFLAIGKIIYQRKWNIISLSFIIVLLTALIVFSLAPIYRATATLLIEANEAQVVSIEQIYGVENGGSEYLLTQFELLKSRQLAKKVVKKLDLVHHPEFDPRQQPEPFISWKSIMLNLTEYLPIIVPDDLTNSPKLLESMIENQVVRAFMKTVTISPIRRTQLVKISVEMTDAKLAVSAANALANGYISSQLDARVNLTVTATSWMNDRLVELKNLLAVSESTLQAYREKENLLDVQGVTNVSHDALSLSNDLLATAQKDRSSAENEYRQVQSMRRAGWRSQTSVPAVIANPLIQDYKTEEAKARTKVDELSRRYGEKHPKMKSAHSELATATENLKQQVAVIIAGIEHKYQLARSAEQSLTAKVSHNKGAIQNIKRKEFKLQELQREVDTNRALYDIFLTRLKETLATTDIDAANARIVDKAVLPDASIKPNKKLIIAMAGFLSLMLGIVLTFLLAALHNTFKSMLDVENNLHIPLLGIMPLVKGKNKKSIASLALGSQDKTFSESVRSIRTSVVLSSLDNPHKIILVTSSIPGEGKSTVSSNLALSLGQMEKVLLIDMDMRKPSVAKNFNFQVGTMGLANLIANTATLEECIHTIEDIDVICAGVIPPNPLELLASKRFTNIIQKLTTLYDRIIIDSPPIQAVSDTLILSTISDTVIYVIKADDTSVPIAKKGLGKLLQHNAAISGVVLNQVDIKKTHKSDHSYAGYYDYYGYGDANHK